jgi:steroid delta-isomerase-like uncharacterized protein
MSVEENKAIARRHFAELWRKGDLPVADEIYAPSAVGHDYSNPEHRDYPESEKQLVVADRAAFPDGQVAVEEQVAEGDTVVTRWTFRGTQTGELMGIPASGNRVSVGGVHIHRIADGKIVEIWAFPESLSFLQQLGVLPKLRGEVELGAAEGPPGSAAEPVELAASSG